METPAGEVETLDLTEVESEVVASAKAAAPPETRPFDPGRKRESIRGWIALILLGLFGLVVVFSLIYVVTTTGQEEELKAILQVIVPPLITLLGTVTGFYFGAHSWPQRGAS